MDAANKLDKVVQEIEEKYQAIGQNPEPYLEGLKYSKPVTYWDYIEVDTLLSLQRPRTTLPDEEIFIMYHQATELFFKMILLEVKQICNHSALDAQFFTERMKRINRYWDILISSYDVMRDGMEVEQYLQFRNALTPASGFQCAQYRIIEICCTDLKQLLYKKSQEKLKGDEDIPTLFEHIYWQAAGKNYQTGKKSLTLQLFEEKYLQQFIQKAQEYKDKNLRVIYHKLPKDQQTEALKEALRNLDRKVNIDWPLMHLKVAEKYLVSKSDTKDATGGSQWRKYLHPKYQRRIFFPELWTQEELDNWGGE